MTNYKKVHMIRVFNADGVLIDEVEWQRTEPRGEAVAAALDTYVYADYAVIEERYKKIT